MELKECIENRRSVRSFRSDLVPDGFVEHAIRMAVLAPSAGNLQARDFIVVSENNMKEKLAAAAHGQDFIKEAPVVMVCCANLNRIEGYGSRGRELYCIQDVAAAVEHIMLVVTEAGLGACWVGAFDENSASVALQLPSHIRPLTIVPIGYPKKEGKRTSRMPLESVMHYERW